MNSLERHIKGWLVVAKGDGPAAGRVFRCEDGSGCDPYDSGTRVNGRFVSQGKDGWIDGMLVERQASDDERTEAARMGGEIPAFSVTEGDMA